MSTASWTDVQDSGDLPKYGGMIKINDEEFIFVPKGHYDKKEKQPWGIHKYSIYSNKWTKFVKYPDNFRPFAFNVLFDENDGKIYIYGEDYADVAEQEYDLQRTTIIDVDTGKFNTFYNSSSATESSNSPCTVFADGNLHIIGGWYGGKHIIFNFRIFQCYLDLVLFIINHRGKLYYLVDILEV